MHGQVFVPLWGEPSQSRLTPCQLPRRGSWRAAPERVLRGEVEIWYKDFDGMAKKFLSPYGDGTTIVGLDCEPEMFSPPYGEVL